ncbi:hypothetical protein NA57DRAFT_70260 [Rhizodiscina lignyota]|uniref:TFIIE beta domain-containing protein n=1 Tax=Rhizodiscina lignyota TaxID=1504668 RepID=A0A9P4IRI2_9PEZI|nr:hypothetical protein NA57DRAFT_70260 [Rhizodiscina lignyota]
MESVSAYSQPSNTGFGVSLPTQLFYTEEYLKDKDRPMTFEDIWSYLSIPADSDTTEAVLKQHLQSGRVKVIYDPKGFGGQGSYRYRPKHDVRSAEQLKEYLQKQTTMQGVDVKELRDGWKDAQPAINALEARAELRVTRNKNGEAKAVWADDPSLKQDIRPDFKAAWQVSRLPANSEELRTQLLDAGLKPATERKVVQSAGKPKEKKRKGPRQSGRMTNVHMQGLLKDYSYLKR